MAKFTAGPIIGQISGSIAGNTFSRNRFGPYIRNKAIPVNPSSPFQQSVRNIFSSLATIWSNILTQIQRDAWNVYGFNIPFTGPLGETVFLTGFNHFIRSNSVAVRGAVPEIDSGPTNFTLAETDPTLAMTASEATQLLSIGFDDTLAWVNEDDALMQILMSRPQGPGTAFIASPFRLAGFLLGDATTPLTSPQTLAVPFAVADGQLTSIKARVLRADGRLSDDFRDTAFVAA